MIYIDYWIVFIWFVMLFSGFDVVVIDLFSIGFRGTLVLMRSWKKVLLLFLFLKISILFCFWFLW